MGRNSLGIGAILAMCALPLAFIIYGVLGLPPHTHPSSNSEETKFILDEFATPNLTREQAIAEPVRWIATAWHSPLNEQAIALVISENQFSRLFDVQLRLIDERKVGPELPNFAAQRLRELVQFKRCRVSKPPSGCRAEERIARRAIIRLYVHSLQSELAADPNVRRPERIKDRARHFLDTALLVRVGETISNPGTPVFYRSLEQLDNQTLGTSLSSYLSLHLRGVASGSQSLPISEKERMLSERQNAYLYLGLATLARALQP